jgi:hypothetical protein
MRKKRSQPNTITLPPRLPKSDEELERAITLLGNRKQAELNPTAQTELRELLGVYPTAKEASLWKRVQRKVCRGVARPAQ